VTQAAATAPAITETAPAITDPIVDSVLRQIEAAWILDEFYALIAANWPAGPPKPPPAAGPGSAEPHHSTSPALLRPQGRLPDPQIDPTVCGRQRAPPHLAMRCNGALDADPDRVSWSGEARKT